MSCSSCGHPSSIRPTQRIRSSSNPKVSGGTRLLYIGSGNKVYGGNSSGLTYYVSDHLRIFAAHPLDVENLLSNSDLIAAP